MRKLIICCLLLMLAACGQSGPAGQAPAATGTTAPATAAPATAMSATPTTGSQPEPTIETGAPGETYLTLEQSGGFAGLTSSMTIDTAGVVRIAQEAGGDPVELTLTPEQLAELRALVDSAEFQELEPKYINANCADCFNYTITVERERGKGAQVIMTNDAADQPAPLAQLLQLLNEVKAGQ